MDLRKLQDEIENLIPEGQTSIDMIAESITEHLHDSGYLDTPQWQPIETAPRDGTPLLICCIKASKYTNVKSGFMAVNRWEKFWGSFNPKYFPATHWMPLPKPPEDTE